MCMHIDSNTCKPDLSVNCKLYMRSYGSRHCTCLNPGYYIYIYNRNYQTSFSDHVLRYSLSM